jgi:hypothetical protein
MTRKKYNVKNYPVSKKGDPITESWTVRKAKIGKEDRLVLVRKINGKRQRRFVEDHRMSPTISWGDAKKFQRSRTKRAKQMDDKMKHQTVIKEPNKSWKRRPGKYDVRRIDEKK